MKQIILFDKWLFLKLNAEYRNALFDWIMPFIRNPYFWAPLYIFILALALQRPGVNGKSKPAGFLLWCQRKFYFFTCRQPFWDGHIYFLYGKLFGWSLPMAVFYMGGHNLLCPNLCRRTFSTGYFRRNHYWLYRWKNYR